MMDPSLLEEELRACAARGKLPKAIIAVDLYGQCADYDRLLELCAEYGIALIEDSAEALGATYKGKMAGSFGSFGIFSFNGNKIITTSSGGMLLSKDVAAIKQARLLANQAREPMLHFQHSTIGYTYRMSNVLAAIGRAQLRVLDQRIAARAKPSKRCGPFWLTCLLIDPAAFGATRDHLLRALEAENIESRPVWKPLHLQPVFAQCRVRGGAVSQNIFEHGLCLPSGSNLNEHDLQRIIGIIRKICANA